MDFSTGETGATKETKKLNFGGFLVKLRKRHIIETLAAFIGGGWLLVEVVERLLVGHYKFPEESIDLTVVSVIGALLATLVWRWFGGTEKRPGNIKVEMLLVPLIILATLSVDLTILLRIIGIGGKTFLIAVVAVCMGIGWIILKSLQWAAAVPLLLSGQVQKPADSPSPASGPPEKSIVVLPFTDLSPQKDQEYFCDGMTEELITDLSPIHELLVISRSSAMTFKGTNKTIPEIARAVNVQYVLEGSVRKADNSLRITAQLIDAQNDAHLWVEKYSGTLEDVFDIQEKVSRSIVEALKIKLSPAELKGIENRPIENVHAYYSYLKARQEIWRFTPEGFDRAFQLVRNALDIVGDNELLQATLGMVYWNYIYWGLRPSEEYLPKLEECIQKVFRRNRESSHGHLLQGWVTQRRGDVQESVRNFKKALAIDPNNPDVLFWICLLYSFVGKTSAARPLAKRLLLVDPLMPINNFIPGTLDWFDGNLKEAIQPFARAYQMDPQNPHTQFWYAYILACNNRIKEALSVLKLLPDGAPTTPLNQAYRFLKYALEGDKKRAMKCVTAELLTTSRDDFNWSWIITDLYSLIDAKQEALDWLENSIRVGVFNYPLLMEYDPFLANIRGEERFKKLMERAKYEWERFEA